MAKALKQMKLNVGEMHSDLEQAQREEVMYEFKAGRDVYKRQMQSMPMPKSPWK